LLVQTPLAVYQRFVEFANAMDTGDPVRGTAATSSSLSMLLLCGIAGIVVFYLRRRIGLFVATFLIGWLFLPTTINETKATLLLLPMAVIAPALLMRRSAKPIRRIMPIIAVGCLALIAFVASYNTLSEYREDGRTIGSFFSEGLYERYLYSGGPEEGANYIGRLDSLVRAVDRLGRDPLTFAFGLGAGNVTTSFLPQFDGEYASYYSRYGVDLTQISLFLWEVGVVGLSAYLLLYWFVISDARALARSDGPLAPLGQLWTTVMLIMTTALLYKSIFSMNEIGYLFWYFGGVVASEAVLLREQQRTHARQQRPAPAAWQSAAGQNVLEDPGLGARRG
jgi:hypothetical protein